MGSLNGSNSSNFFIEKRSGNKEQEVSKELFNKVVSIARGMQSNTHEITHLFLHSLNEGEGLVKQAITEIDGPNGVLMGIYQNPNDGTVYDGEKNSETKATYDDENIADTADQKAQALLKAVEGVIMDYINKCIDKGEYVDLSQLNELVGGILKGSQDIMDRGDLEAVQSLNKIQNDIESLAKSKGKINDEDLINNLGQDEKKFNEFDALRNVLEGYLSGVNNLKNDDNRGGWRDEVQNLIRDMKRDISSDGYGDPGFGTSKGGGRTP